MGVIDLFASFHIAIAIVELWTYLQAVEQFFSSILEFFSDPQQFRYTVGRNIEIAPKSSFAYCSHGKNIYFLGNSTKNVSVKIPKHFDKLPRQVRDKLSKLLEISEIFGCTQDFFLHKFSNDLWKIIGPKPEHGKLGFAGKLVYLTRTGKNRPPTSTWTHV